ncbi:phytanoyl-CoA dioxygenase family protein [Streptomyces sp. NPDC001903]|uniref:phytanoyl-CoA dioxygenase family protein n=1 Tax=Streptomyces sp. NPDC001903 TaxID=3364622 RepID=UPI0036ACA640
MRPELIPAAEAAGLGDRETLTGLFGGKAADLVELHRDAGEDNETHVVPFRLVAAELLLAAAAPGPRRWTHAEVPALDETPGSAGSGRRYAELLAALPGFDKLAGHDTALRLSQRWPAARPVLPGADSSILVRDWSTWTAQVEGLVSGLYKAYTTLCRTGGLADRGWRDAGLIVTPRMPGIVAKGTVYSQGERFAVEVAEAAGTRPSHYATSRAELRRTPFLRPEEADRLLAAAGRLRLDPQAGVTDLEFVISRTGLVTFLQRRLLPAPAAPRRAQSDGPVLDLRAHDRVTGLRKLAEAGDGLAHHIVVLPHLDAARADAFALLAGFVRGHHPAPAGLLCAEDTGHARFGMRSHLTWTVEHFLPGTAVALLPAGAPDPASHGARLEAGTHDWPRRWRLALPGATAPRAPRVHPPLRKDHPAMAPHHPVAPDGPRPLDAATELHLAKDHYERHGFVHLRNLLDADLAPRLRAESDRLHGGPHVHPDNVRTPFRKQSGDAPERMDPVCDISPLIDGVARDKRILDLLTELFEGRRAALFKDKLIFKMPGTKGYTAHQDAAYFPEGHSASVSVQIDAADRDNGLLSFFSGYHRTLLTPPGELRNWTAEEEAAWLDPAREYAPPTLPGDVIVFSGLTPHRSGRNTSDRARRSLYLTYLAGGSEDLRTEYYEAYVSRFATDGRFFR